MKSLVLVSFLLVGLLTATGANVYGGDVVGSILADGKTGLLLSLDNLENGVNTVSADIPERVLKRINLNSPPKGYKIKTVYTFTSPFRPSGQRECVLKQKVDFFVRDGDDLFEHLTTYYPDFFGKRIREINEIPLAANGNRRVVGSHPSKFLYSFCPESPADKGDLFANVYSQDVLHTVFLMNIIFQLELSDPKVARVYRETLLSLDWILTQEPIGEVSDEGAIDIDYKYLFQMAVTRNKRTRVSAEGWHKQIERDGIIFLPMHKESKAALLSHEVIFEIVSAIRGDITRESARVLNAYLFDGAGPRGQLNLKKFNSEIQDILKGGRNERAN